MREHKILYLSSSPPFCLSLQWAPLHDDNLILLTDSYKLTHYKQYPPG